MKPRTLSSCTLLAGLWLAALLPASALAKKQRYELDPVHSRIVFLVEHAGFSRAIGTFSGLSGQLWFDPDAPATGSVDASVPIASLELGDAKWRKSVLDPTFFDAADHPAARFVSRQVESSTPTQLRVVGELELHGVRRPVTLEATFNKLDRHPLTLRRTLGFSARTVLRRSDFGMLKWKNLVGDEVEVLIEIEAVRKRAAPRERD
jgi:polyisoprenoid-binding protein YceI